MTRPRTAVVLCAMIASAPALAAGKRPPVGTGVSGLDYWGTERPFVDAFKTSRPWTSGTKDREDDGRPLDLDARGWVRSLKPGQVARSLILFEGGDLAGSRTSGRYAVEYEGEGKLEYEWAGRLAESAPGRDLIEVDASSGTGVTLTLAAVNPANYVRNIRVVRADSALPRGELFDPVFLDRLEGYRVVRFANWMLGSNADVKQRRWKERPTPQDARWSEKGAPVEVMTALANRLRADPWFTIPHAADDDYMRRFAQAVAKSLDPRRKVYLEYSNEVWNETYPQTAYARERGLALGLGADPHEAVIRFYARRATELFSIWEKVLGRGRPVRVLSFQSGNAEATELALSFGDTRRRVDAVAIAPYFGYDLSADAAASAKTARMSLDELMRELETVALPAAKKEMLAEAAVARKHGLPMISYEGGQHLVDFRPDAEHDPALDALYDAANRDPRMGVLYARNLRDWVEAGGGLFMHLENCEGYGPHGRWGALEYVSQPRAEAPKYDALRRFMEGK